MTKRKGLWIVAAAAAIVVPALVGVLQWSPRAEAADHNDPPGPSGATTDPAADIADLYAWHDAASNKLVVILTWAGFAAPAVGQTGMFDRDVLYTLYIDNDRMPATTEFEINIRFGQNAAGEWGVKVEGLPGATAPLTGAVETTLTDASGAKVHVGLFDDPFFFDLTGFRATLDTGTLMFMPTRDALAGRNATAIVLELPLDMTLAGGDLVTVWSSTARIAG